jgi:hypothetical protein
MITDDLEKLKYPIGKFVPDEKFTDALKTRYISEMEELPSQVLQEYKALKENGRLDVAYRPDGWTGRQVIHHLADSHMNAFIRFKLTLTEENPVIKPYQEAEWANLKDSLEMDPIVAIELLRSIHTKLIFLIKGMTDAEFSRTYVHPQYQKTYALSTVMGLYAWHGKHHLGHLRIINS